MKSLRRIFQTCTCLWGGAYNPIIPVSATLPDAWRERHPLPNPDPVEIAKGYIDFFEPDVFVEAQEGLAREIGLTVGDLDFDSPRLVSLDAFFTKGDRFDPDVPLGTNIFHLYEDLYEREFKFVSRHERRVALMTTETENAPFVECFMGGFPDAGPLSGLAQAYQDAFEPVTLAPTAENWMKVVKEGFLFPLFLTQEGLKLDRNGWHEPTIFLADPTSPLDLIDLWNLHIFRSRVLPVNISWLKETGDFLNEILKANHRPLPGNPNGVMIHTTIQVGRSISEERARTAMQDAGIVSSNPLQWAYKLWYDDVWRQVRDDFPSRTRRPLVTAETTNLELTIAEEDSEAHCRFASLSPKFAEPYGSGGARWVNVLKFQNYGNTGTLALTLPASFTGESSSRMRRGHATLISREGFVLPQKYKDVGEDFLVLNGRDAVIEWLKRHGVEAQAADPGRVADQILASLGGFWGIRLIADRETLKLLDEMSKSTTKYIDGRIEEFPDRSVEVKRWKDLLNRRANQPFFRGISLDGFIKSNILRLGLVLECPYCSKKNWYGIDPLSESVKCERCLKDYPFPQGSLHFERTPWHYRVVGPFSVPNYAEGAYATVLSLNTFARDLNSHPANVTYATNLHYRIGKDVPFEVDFTLWYQPRRILDLEMEPVLIFGEAKSFATEGFQQADVDRMRKLGEKFPGAFLVFATLKDNLSDTEKKLVSDLALWGRGRLNDGKPHSPVIVLTGIELFAPWDIREAWKVHGGRHAGFIGQGSSMRLGDLWNFAEITQHLYLDLPSIHSHLVPGVAAAPPSETTLPQDSSPSGA
ncbi:hypothetical protein P8935_23075 [Telmatobacter sp. DSM 110680]|uniref:Uncharacterized protein n=1 Tax=Telmatobacter sp. DSM 110680 TaxID=3036704 RepID=A0AAU7DK25_9BACT